MILYSGTAIFCATPLCSFGSLHTLCCTTSPAVHDSCTACTPPSRSPPDRGLPDLTAFWDCSFAHAHLHLVTRWNTWTRTSFLIHCTTARFLGLLGSHTGLHLGWAWDLLTWIPPHSLQVFFSRLHCTDPLANLYTVLGCTDPSRIHCCSFLLQFPAPVLPHSPALHSLVHADQVTSPLLTPAQVPPRFSGTDHHTPPIWMSSLLHLYAHTFSARTLWDSHRLHCHSPTHLPLCDTRWIQGCTHCLTSPALHWVF